MRLKKVVNGFLIDSQNGWSGDHVFETREGETEKETFERAIRAMRVLSEERIKETLKEFADV